MLRPITAAFLLAHPAIDVEPREFQALLADPAHKLEGVELAKGLQKLLSSYSGLIEGGQQLLPGRARVVAAGGHCSCNGLVRIGCKGPQLALRAWQGGARSCHAPLLFLMV